MTAILEVQNLSKSFGTLAAVNNLSFQVEKGAVYGFLGQNGAGKSTTIRMLLSLIKPDTGHIHLFGKNLANHRSDILKQVGAVIEKPDLYKFLSAYDNLKIFARLSGLNPDNSTLRRQLEQVGLSGRENDPVKTFSQGMKQRLGIAIALIHNPDLVILDEPTNGLDPQGIADIRNLIFHLSHHERKTIFISSHLLNEIEQVASHVLIIDKGRKVAEGPSATLFDPAETIVELITENNDQTQEKIHQGQWSHHFYARRATCLVLKMHRKNVPDFHRWLVQESVDVVSLQPRHSLEDYFIQVTTHQQHVPSYTN
jgi:ABC-type multidrug transport system ATPase subunit